MLQTPFMKILLTGGSGYIGSVTTELLCDDGHEVVVFDNLERGHREAVDPRAKLMVGDLRDPQPIREAMRQAKPDAVVHFAAGPCDCLPPTSRHWSWMPANLAGWSGLIRRNLKPFPKAWWRCRTN